MVVLDAGIATDDNLKLLTKILDRLTVLMDTKSKQTIRLKAITTTKNTDYYLEVKSQTKALKETGMRTNLKQEIGKIISAHLAAR